MVGDTHKIFQWVGLPLQTLFGLMVGDTHKFFCMGWSADADCFGFMVGDRGPHVLVFGLVCSCRFFFDSW